MNVRTLPVLTLAIVLFVAACDSTQPTPTLASLIVSCDASRLTSFGQQSHCTARATLSSGQTEDRTAAAQWSSSDSSKVTVNGGLVTAVAAGSADVTAKIDTLSAKQTVTVDVGCAFTLSPPSAIFGATGGSQSVTVSASPDGCQPSAWTAASDSTGLTVSPGEGNGTGTVTVTAAANGTQAQARTATIAGQRFTANVNGACTVAFSPAGSDDTGSSAGQRDVSVVVTNGPCRWTASSSDNWITVSQTEGTTNATVRLNFTANNGLGRAGSVTFAGPECNPQCRNGSTTIFIRQARSTAIAILSLTLTQGEELSGPHAGFATGPNGFTCTLRQDPTVCPALHVPAGTSVTIVITLTDGTLDAPIFRTAGCDSRGPGSCTVMMNGDRSVTIGLGCAVCGVLEPLEAEPRGEMISLPADGTNGVAPGRTEIRRNGAA